MVPTPTRRIQAIPVRPRRVSGHLTVRQPENRNARDFDPPSARATRARRLLALPPRLFSPEEAAPPIHDPRATKRTRRSPMFNQARNRSLSPQRETNPTRQPTRAATSRNEPGAQLCSIKRQTVHSPPTRERNPAHRPSSKALPSTRGRAPTERIRASSRPGRPPKKTKRTWRAPTLLPSTPCMPITAAMQHGYTAPHPRDETNPAPPQSPSAITAAPFEPEVRGRVGYASWAD
jgi:hypothetical protein